MNTDLQKFLAGETMDADGVRRHADGTICKAESPDTCPFNKKAEKGDRLEVATPESNENDPAKRIESKIAKAFEDAGLKGWGEIDVYVDGDEVQIEGGVDLPFGKVNYKLGKNRGYRDVWEDEAEIDDYKSKFEDAVMGVLDDEGIDVGYEMLDWREDNNGRGDVGHKFSITGKMPNGGTVSAQDEAAKAYLAMCQG